MSLYDGNWEPFLFLKLLLEDLKDQLKRQKKKKKWRDAFSMGKTYYSILGVPENASYDEIKSAYREQIRFFHPDIFKGSPEVANEKTKELNEAYAVLSNSDERTKYDYWLKMQRLKKEAKAQKERAERAEEAKEKKKYQETEEGAKQENDNASSWSGGNTGRDSQTNLDYKKIARVTILCLIAVFILSELLTANKVSDTQYLLDQATEENRELKQNYEAKIEELNKELISNEENLVDSNNFLVDSAIEMAFYKQAYDHYSILTNSLNLISSFPSLFTGNGNIENVNSQIDLLLTTMKNTTNLYTTYCEGDEEIEKTLNDLAESNRIAIESIHSLADNGELRTVTLKAREAYNNCQEKETLASNAFWAAFFETQRGY